MGYEDSNAPRTSLNNASRRFLLILERNDYSDQSNFVTPAEAGRSACKILSLDSLPNWLDTWHKLCVVPRHVEQNRKHEH